MQGDWKLRVKGANRDQIDINLIFNYDLELVLSPLSGSSYKAGDKVDVKAHLESGGQPLADPGLMKTSKATLLVTDTAANRTEEVALAAAGTDYAGTWTIADNKVYELKVRVEDASFYRESEPVTVDAAKGTVTAPSPSASPAAPPQAEKPFPWVYVYIGLAVLIAVVCGILVMARVKKANRGFIGQLIVEVRDRNTGERTHPQFKKLNAFKGKVKLHQIMQLAPEYAETDRIVFEPGRGDTLVLFNRSECTVEKAGRAVDASGGITLKKQDRVTILLVNTDKTIQLEFIL